MVSLTKTLGAAAVATALSVSVPATAATIWLDRNASSASAGDLVFTDGQVKVRVSAWTYNASNQQVYSATLGVWDEGLGVSYSGDNAHTVDNSGRRDFLLFQFDTNVELDRAWFNTGWYNMNDTDATIGYGNSAQPWNSDLNLGGLNLNTALAGLTRYDSNSTTSWGNSAGLGNQNRDINPGNFSGNYWMIGASFSNNDKQADGFKLEKLTYNAIPAVPEPGTWLMMILGFGVIGGVMRRRNVEVRSAAFAA